MACSQTLAGLNGSCENSKGGITKIYVANSADISALTWNSANTIITAITMTGEAKFYEYDFKKNVGSMTSTLNVDDANGINFVQTELVVQFNKMDTQKRIEMKALSLSDLVVIVVDSNNKMWYLGLNEPVSASAGTAQTGQNRTDGNYYQITLQANDDTYPIEFQGTVPTE